jgi:hypothetical protein
MVTSGQRPLEGGLCAAQQGQFLPASLASLQVQLQFLRCVSGQFFSQVVRE